MKHYTKDMLSNKPETISDFYRDRESAWSRHIVDLAREANETLYRKQKAIAQIQLLFDMMEEDVQDDKVDDHTIKNYCYELLSYCDFSNDWREWYRWANRLIQAARLTDKVWLLYGLARHLEEIGQYAEALANHKEGLSICEEQPDSIVNSDYWRGVHLLGLGIILQRLDQFDEAESNLKQSIRLFSDHIDPSDEHSFFRKADALANLASCYSRQRKFDLAITNYQESINILKQIGNQFDLGRIFYSIGITYTSANRAEEASSAFDEAKSLCRETENTHFLARSYYGAAFLQYWLGNFNVARAEMEEAFELYDQANRSEQTMFKATYPEAEGNMYLFAGALYTKLGEFNAASGYLDRAEFLYSQIEGAEPLLAKVLANRARIHEFAGNYVQAEFLFLDLLELGKKRHDPLICGDASVHLIRIFSRTRTTPLRWFRLLGKLGFYGLYGTFWGYKIRLERYRSLKKKSRRTDDI